MNGMRGGGLSQSSGNQFYGNNNNFAPNTQPSFNNHQPPSTFYNQKGSQMNTNSQNSNSQGNQAYFGSKNNYNNNNNSKHQNNPVSKEKIDYNSNGFLFFISINNREKK